MKSIYYRQENGSLGITSFLSEEAAKETIQLFEKNNTPFKEITELTKIDDFFFDAYAVSSDAELEVNFTKAKEIQKNKWRYLRNEIFSKLDIEFMRAIESGDASKQDLIKSQKQALRNVTSIDLPDSLEEIKNTIPDILDVNKYQPVYSTNFDENGLEILQ
jgi:hypothetical protein